MEAEMLSALPPTFAPATSPAVSWDTTLMMTPCFPNGLPDPADLPWRLLECTVLERTYLAPHATGGVTGATLRQRTPICGPFWETVALHVLTSKACTRDPYVGLMQPFFYMAMDAEVAAGASAEVIHGRSIWESVGVYM